jgi:hypothetical protein
MGCLSSFLLIPMSPNNPEPGRTMLGGLGPVWHSITLLFDPYGEGHLAKGTLNLKNCLKGKESTAFFLDLQDDIP